MGAFSSRMRAMVSRLIIKYGNSCLLKKTYDPEYDPDTGETNYSSHTISTYSAPMKEVSIAFPTDGINTGLIGFNKNKVVIPWLDEEIDATWEFNDNKILTVETLEIQDEIVAYIINIGEK
jgi:hypothetical protein